MRSVGAGSRPRNLEQWELVVVWLFALACLLPSFWVSFFVTALMRWVAPRWGLIDRPAARKVHTVPTALGGGVGIWAGVVLPLGVAQILILLWCDHPPDWFPPGLAVHLPGALSKAGQLWAVVGAGTVLSVMGLLDDFRPLPWKPRMAIQVLVSLFVVWWGVRATLFLPIPWLMAIVTIGWYVMLVNSFNFLDNMDGLSSGIALISSLIFAVMMLGIPGDPRWLVAGYLLILAGSVVGFLCHNWSPARIFMGDSGSYFLGFSMASMTVLGTFFLPEDGRRHVILAPFCVLAVPLYDTTSVVFLRLREGRSPFMPDKRHFSHRLVDMGLTKVQAVLTIYLCTLTTGLAGVALYSVPDWWSAMPIVAMVGCVLLIIAVLEAAQNNRARAATASVAPVTTVAGGSSSSDQLP